MKQQEILKSIIPELRSDPSITAVMLMGSVATGTEYSTSDLDIYILGNKNKFQTDFIDNIYVEYYYHTYENAQSKLDKCGPDVYQYLGSKIIYDLDGRLIKLTRYAMSKYKNYQVSEKERGDLRHWLYSTKIKIDAALNNQDAFKADFIMTTSSWKIVEVIFAINDIPLPPISRVMNELNNLHMLPGNDWFVHLFGNDINKRRETMFYIMDWAFIRL